VKEARGGAVEAQRRCESVSRWQRKVKEKLGFKIGGNCWECWESGDSENFYK